MKMKYNRIIAAGTVFVMFCIGTDSLPAYGAEASVDADETMHVGLDYYSRTDKTNVVKEVGLNGRTESMDYGTYENVINMSNSIEPVLGDGTATWQPPQARRERFYYKCAVDKNRMVLPWNFDVSYKLNGVPTDADKLAGASGLIEINVKAEPDDNAGAYYRNNMMLMVTVPVGMSKCCSVGAEGSQTQSLGDTMAVVFTALPREDGAYIVRIGTDSSETIGVTVAMVPGTVEDLEHIKDLKEAKDTWQDARDELYDSLEQMAKSVENMRQGVNQVRQGTGSAESARQKWSNFKDNILAGNDQTLAALTVVSQQMDTTAPHLQTTKDCAKVVRSSMNDIVSTPGDMQDPLRRLQTRPKSTESSAGGTSNDLSEPKKTMESIIALDTQLQASQDILLTYLGLYKSSSVKVRRLYDEELDEKELEDMEDVDYEVLNGGDYSPSGGSGSQEDTQNNNQGNDQESGSSGSSMDGKDDPDGGAGGSGTEEGSGGGSIDGNEGASGSGGEIGSGDTDGSGGASGGETGGGNGSGSIAGGGGASGSETESGSGSTAGGGGVSRSETGSGSGSGDTTGEGNTGGNPAENSTASGDTGSSAPDTGAVISSVKSAGNTGSTGLIGITVTAPIERKDIPLVSSLNSQEAVKAIEQALYGGVAVLQELPAQSKFLTGRISSLMDDTSDSARYSAGVVDNMDYLIEDLETLNDSLDVYYPDLQTALDDSREPVWRTMDALNNGISTLVIIQNTLKGSSDDFDAAARDGLRSSMELLDKSLNTLDSIITMCQAGRTMKDTIDNGLDKFDTDNRFPFMDLSADKVSFIPDRNKLPKTLQIVMRTDEISVNDNMAKTANARAAKVKESPLRRMWNVLAQMWKVMVSIFKNRQKRD